MKMKDLWKSQEQIDKEKQLEKEKQQIEELTPSDKDRLEFLEETVLQLMMENAKNNGGN